MGFETKEALEIFCLREILLILVSKFAITGAPHGVMRAIRSTCGLDPVHESYLAVAPAGRGTTGNDSTM